MAFSQLNPHLGLRPLRLCRWSGNGLCSLIGAALIAMALFAVWIGFPTPLKPIFAGGSPTAAVLNSVGLVVSAPGLFDVGKYLVEEGGFGERLLFKPGEVRKRLTRFLSLLIIALGLEARVCVFKDGRTGSSNDKNVVGLELLLYPRLLIVGIAIHLVALGWYQQSRLKAEASEESPHHSQGRQTVGDSPLPGPFTSKGPSAQ